MVTWAVILTTQEADKKTQVQSLPGTSYGLSQRPSYAAEQVPDQPGQLIETLFLREMEVWDMAQQLESSANTLEILDLVPAQHINQSCW